MYLLSIIVLCVSLDITNDFSIANFDPILNDNGVCSSGYYDSSKFACDTCPSGQTVDSSLVDGVGSSFGCLCNQGLRKLTPTCTEVFVVFIFISSTLSYDIYNKL
ncbi:hypothetical protein EON65_33920 [archaeon]|nr:MAG: hypothetical protein EON65_33920 [archaeon]